MGSSRAHRARPALPSVTREDEQDCIIKSRSTQARASTTPTGCRFTKPTAFAPAFSVAAAVFFAAPAAPVLTASRARFWYCFFKRCLRHIRETGLPDISGCSWAAMRK